MSDVTPDPDYEYVPATQPNNAFGKKGRQCGQCGTKFDFNVSYGYCCSWINCPMGWGPVTFSNGVGSR